MSPQKGKKEDSPNKFIQFTAIAFQMGATIFLGNYLGKWIDEKNETTLWESTVTLIAVFLSIYIVIRGVIRLNKE